MSDLPCLCMIHEDRGEECPNPAPPDDVCRECRVECWGEDDDEAVSA